MADVFCNNCGHKNPAESNFCSSCGQPLERPATEPHTITFALDQLAPGDEVDVDLSDVGPGGVLIVTRGPNTGSEFALEHVITTAGRHPDSDIFLDDITVSRRHAEIRLEGTHYLVSDVGSLNGTYLNGDRVDVHELAEGDQLQVGKYRLVFAFGAHDGDD